MPGILPYSISEMQPPILHPKSRKLGKLSRAFGPFQKGAGGNKLLLRLSTKIDKPYPTVKPTYGSPHW